MEAMKEGVGKAAVMRVSQALSQVMPEFDQSAFIQQACLGLETLALKERVAHIITVLALFLPDDFITTAKVLKACVAVWDHGDEDDPLRSFAAWPLTDFVAVYGLAEPEESLLVLKKLTPLFSAEFAIRPFIIQYPEYCAQQFAIWVNDECEHVRRLVSEGTRPRLPWGMRLHVFVKNPHDNLALLSALSLDPSLYVRRSVANHLNDIAKDHPQVVIDVCTQWQQGMNALAAEQKAQLTWLIKHATRSLVKAGLPAVFPLLGYTSYPAVELSTITLDKAAIELGETLGFSCSIESKTEVKQKLVIDYAIYFVKANGGQKAKVFKLKNITLTAKAKLQLNKLHSIKKITTRQYYPGQHRLAVMVNGVEVSSVNFELLRV